MGTAFIIGGWLPDDRRGQKMNALMHVTDWLPTLCAISETTPSGSYSLDGYDRSNNILYGVDDIFSPREEILHNIVAHGGSDLQDCFDTFCGAIRWRNYKLVIGVDWIMNFTYEAECENLWCDSAMVNKKTVKHSIRCASESDGGNYRLPALTANDCLFNHGACLFDMATDPCEYTDIGPDNQEIVTQLTNKLAQYNEDQADPLYRYYVNNLNYEDADPDNFGGYWSSWVKEGSVVVDSDVEFISKGKNKRSVLHNLLTIGCLILGAVVVLVLLFGLKYLKRRTADRIEYSRIKDMDAIDVSASARITI